MKTFSDVDVHRREFLRLIPDLFRRKVQNATGYFTSKNSAAIDESVGVHKASPQIARIDVDLCIAREGAMCQACYVACPLRDRAIRIEDQLPLIFDSVCDGCGKCVNACRTVNDHVAIQMVTGASGV